jgi:hypothetical protein
VRKRNGKMMAKERGEMRGKEEGVSRKDSMLCG